MHAEGHSRDDVDVRLALPSDAPAISAIFSECYARYHYQSVLDRELLSRAIESGETIGFVAELAGEIAGYGAATIEGPRVRLQNLLTHERYRGLRIGSSIEDYRLAHLRLTSEPRVIYASCLSSDILSQTMKEHRGFSPVSVRFGYSNDSQDIGQRGSSIVELCSEGPAVTGLCFVPDECRPVVEHVARCGRFPTNVVDCTGPDTPSWTWRGHWLPSARRLSIEVEQVAEGLGASAADLLTSIGDPQPDVAVVQVPIGTKTAAGFVQALCARGFSACGYLPEFGYSGEPVLELLSLRFPERVSLSRVARTDTAEELVQLVAAGCLKENKQWRA